MSVIHFLCVLRWYLSGGALLLFGLSRNLDNHLKMHFQSLIQQKSSLPPLTRWEALPYLLDLCHGNHTIPAQDVDLACCPDGLAAVGTNQLAGAAGPFAALGGSGACLRRSPRPGPYHGRQAGPPDLDFVPPL